MKLKTLQLHNFRRFRYKDLTLNEQFTVLIGDNGVGKTSILDGLAVSLGSYISGFSGVKSRYIRKADVHRKYKLFDIKLDIQEQYPVEVITEGIIDDENIRWAREINNYGGTTTSKNSKVIAAYAKRLEDKVRNGEEVILPVVSYYTTQRLWVTKNESVSKIKSNRLEGYENCLEPMSNIKKVFKWIEDLTYIGLQEGKKIQILEAVNIAVKETIQDCQGFEYNVKHKTLLVEINNEKIPFDLLSDGYRGVIGLIIDIAIKMATLNPFLGKNICKETPGVVLIDEIDLHLHPNWQKTIVDSLKRTFPKVQFIVTTHSPFIIQSLKPGELRKLDLDNEEIIAEYYVNKSIEEISENVMDVNEVQKSSLLIEKRKVAEEYFKLLREGFNPEDKDVDTIKKRLDYLESLYSDDVAYYAFLKVKREVTGWGD